MRRFSIIIFLLGFWLYGKSEIVINEVFYDAVGSDDDKEWIELYNNGPDDINLVNWVLQAGGTDFNDIFTFPAITIRANAFFLICEFPHPLANIVTELGFENGGTATDGIRIINPHSQYTDTVLYDFPNVNNLMGDTYQQLPSPGVSPGQSLARITDGLDTNSCDDWFSSSTPSPGLSNLMERSATLHSCAVELNQTEMKVSTVISNLSTQDVDKSELSIKILFNSELKYHENLDSIPGLDSLSHNITIDNEFLTSGLLEIELVNNTNILIVDNCWEKWINYQNPALFLSEIMYYPLINLSEWIEVKLLADINDIQLTIEDASGSQAQAKISGSLGDYIVIAKDRANVISTYPECDSLKVYQAEGWTPLNNTGDIVVIKYYQTSLDSVLYEANSTSAGYSLEFNERSREWMRSNAIGGASPTEGNSFSDIDIPNVSGLKIFNNLISIKKEKQFCVKFNSQKLVSSLDLQIFDIRGRELETITTNFSDQYSGEYYWNGYVKGKYLASGLYPIVINIKADNGRILEERKSIITINR